MTLYLDSSVLVAALVEDEPAHEVCLALLRKKNLAAWTHALAEVFATLTGGRLGLRVPPAVAAELMQASLMPRLRLIELSGADVIDAIGESERAGVCGARYSISCISSRHVDRPRRLCTRSTTDTS